MTDSVKELEAQLKEARKSQLFCNFLSPGTLFSEQRRIEIESRDLVKLAAYAKAGVVERHGAKPYGFRFEDGNGKALTGVHWLTGRVVRYDDVPDDKEHQLMRSNMCDPECCVVVENTNSYRFTGEFGEEDILIDWEGNVLCRGNDADIVAYRAAFRESLDAGR